MKSIYAYVEKSDNFRFRTVLNDGSQTDWAEYPLSAKTLKEEAKKGGFFSRYMEKIKEFGTKIISEETDDEGRR